MSAARQEKVRNIVCLLAGSFVYSVGTHCFVVPANIAPGGASGLALMVNFVTGLPVGVLTMVVNIPLLILAWIYLSRKFAVSTAMTCIACSVILDFVVAPVFPMYTGDRLLSSLFGGVIVGAGMALIFMSGSTTGGSDILGYILQKKKPHLSIGRALIIVDGVVLALSIFVFQNVESGLLGMISLYACTRVIDAILYGNDAGSMVTIVSRYPQRIADRIIQDLERSATVMNGRGAYSRKDTGILLCTVRRSQFGRLKQIIRETDSSAFVMVTETTEVFGEGFKEIVS
ncbi:YitT family protein [Enterocloster lavalensis]|uniref:YitT family protein n=1 Tax=Enterocloster lavalensis TaxID=460384 RepID=UPI0023F4E48A|nr:YitT family protein [Enterocloster lavalensis]